MPTSSTGSDIPDGEFVADANALKATAESQRLRREELTVPISPSAPLNDELLCEQARDGNKKYFVPRYFVQKHVASGAAGGPERSSVWLKGNELRVTLQRGAAPSVISSAPAATALTHRVAVTLLHGSTAESFQEATVVPEGLLVTLKSADANQLFYALTSDRSARLRIRRQVEVALNIDLGPESEQLRLAHVRHATLSRQKVSADAAVAAQRTAVGQQQERVQKLTQKIHDLPGVIAAHQPAIQKLNGQIARIIASHHGHGRVDEGADDLLIVRAKVEPLRKQIAAHEQQRKAEQQQLAQAQAALPAANADLAAAQKALQDAVDRAAQLAAQLVQVQAEVRALEKTLRIDASSPGSSASSSGVHPAPLYRKSSCVLDSEVPFLFPKDLHPYIYRDIEDLFPAGEWRELDGPSRNGRQIYVQRGEQPWVFYVLPTSFALAFQAAEGVPAFKPRVYAEASAGDFPEPRDMRVRLLLTAVPVIDPYVRAYLHQHVAKLTEQPFVLLRPAAAIEHAEYRPEIEPASTGAPAVSTPTVQAGGSIDLRDGFTLEYHLRLDDYMLLVKQQLASSAAGLRGNVFVTLHVRDKVLRLAIDVKLSFADLDLNCIGATWNPSERGTGSLKLHNPTTLDLSIGHIDVSLLRTTAAGQPLEVCAAGVTQPLPIALSDGKDLNIPLTLLGDPARILAGQAVAWNAAEIEVSGVRAPGFSPQRWLESVHRAADQAKVYKPISVFVVNLARACHDDALLAGVKVIIGQASQAPVDHFIAPENPTWATHVLRTLSQLLGSGDDADRYTLRYHSVYGDGSEGLPQRMHSAETSPVVAALCGERPGSRYAVHMPHGSRAQLQDLHRAAAHEVIAWLDAQDATWSLTVLSEDSAEDPRDYFDVHSGLLDFSGPLRFAIVTLKSLQDTTTLTLNSASVTPQIWRPAQRSSTVDFEVTYVLDGSPPQSVRGQTGAGFLLLKPPR